MRTQGIRRLPVVNSGALAGIRCLNEIALNAKKVGALSRLCASNALHDKLWRSPDGRGSRGCYELICRA